MVICKFPRALLLGISIILTDVLINNIQHTTVCRMVYEPCIAVLFITFYCRLLIMSLCSLDLMFWFINLRNLQVSSASCFLPRFPFRLQFVASYVLLSSAHRLLYAVDCNCRLLQQCHMQLVFFSKHCCVLLLLFVADAGFLCTFYRLNRLHHIT